MEFRVQPCLIDAFEPIFNFRGIPVGFSNHSIQQYLTGSSQSMEPIRVCDEDKSNLSCGGTETWLAPVLCDIYQRLILAVLKYHLNGA